MNESPAKVPALRGGGVCAILILTMALWAHCGVGAMAAEGYGIQVAAYKDRQEADQRVDQLKRLGHQAFSRREAVPGKGKWYRVYIAEYPTQEEAEKEARILRDLELIEDYDIRTLKSRDDKEHRDMPEEGAYVLHVGSFKARANAAKEVENLKKLGHDAFFREEEISGETWYRVYLGGYDSEKEARAAGEGLKQKGGISYFKPFPSQ
ncbi:MAG: SPOR domain-containing protein [Desulfobacteraceae bacterium]